MDLEQAMKTYIVLYVTESGLARARIKAHNSGVNEGFLVFWKIVNTPIPGEEMTAEDIKVIASFPPGSYVLYYDEDEADVEFIDAA